jgi:3-methylcrotonyl-CoA carboxylase alpha subunit
VAWHLSTQAKVRHDDPHSPWSCSSGLRLGLPSAVVLHLSCAAEHRVIRLQGDDLCETQWLGEQLVSEHNDVRRQTRAMRRDDTLYLSWQGELHAIRRYDPIAAVDASHIHQGGLTAPMNGSIVRVLVEVGQAVEAGTPLVVLEAMKMEHSIRASTAGTVSALYCTEGEMVSEGTVLVELNEVTAVTAKAS